MLDSKIALVTGASRGIGKAIAEVFTRNGAVVYANAREKGCLDNLNNDNLIPIYFDVTDKSAVKSAFMQIRKEQGKLDILINNAGIMKDALIGMISEKDTREMFEVNVFAAIDLIQLASKFMIRQKSGSIINVSSLVGVSGNQGQLAYSASKGAIIAMTKTAAKELAQYNIRVNSVAPGIIDTDLHKSVASEHMIERKSNIGMGRMGTSDDIANACLFLASDLSSYVTGQVIGVDGSTVM